MTIHTFGAYFGLMVTRVLYRPNLDRSKHRNSSVYHSDLFAMIGELLMMEMGVVYSDSPHEGVLLGFLQVVLLGVLRSLRVFLWS